MINHDDSDRDEPKRPAKPQLQRSRSEHGLRHEDTDQTDDEMYEWGARHGFEDHYQSEDIISQLANVSAQLQVTFRHEYPRRFGVCLGLYDPRVISSYLKHSFSLLSVLRRMQIPNANSELVYVLY